MPHRNAACTLCSDTGTLGRDPDGGGRVYCTCRKGLEAHINHLAYVLQEYANALVLHDARAVLGRVVLSEETVEDLRFALRMTQRAHDELEARWSERVCDEIELSEPAEGFFPDYQWGDLIAL